MAVLKVLFLDIDGVVLPNRAEFLPNQTWNLFNTVFDPCAVGMLNAICARSNRKIVLHSSWIRTAHLDKFHGGDVVGHLISQGVEPALIHPDDPYCNRDIRYRYDRVVEWLARHPEVTEFVVVDNEPLPPEHRSLSENFVLTNEDEGITVALCNKLRDGAFKR